MTSYTDIFDRFALKIEDFVLLQLDDDDVIQACLNWMLAALPKIRKMTSDLTDRDDEIMEFNCDLTETEIEVIANMMVAEWLQPQVYSQKNINQMYGGKEEKLKEIFLLQLATNGNVVVYSFEYAGNSLEL